MTMASAVRVLYPALAGSWQMSAGQIGLLYAAIPLGPVRHQAEQRNGDKGAHRRRQHQRARPHGLGQLAAGASAVRVLYPALAGSWQMSAGQIGLLYAAIPLGAAASQTAPGTARPTPSAASG
jgi:hypothetical protein